jgi:hypothetical protein
MIAPAEEGEREQDEDFVYGGLFTQNKNFLLCLPICVAQPDFVFNVKQTPSQTTL